MKKLFFYFFTLFNLFTPIESDCIMIMLGKYYFYLKVRKLTDKFYIKGGTPLRGEVSIGGAKNSVLKLMAAAILAKGETKIYNVPDLTDVEIMLNVIAQLGTKTSYDKAGKLVTKDVELTLIPYYAWAHRGEGDMEVWLPIDVSATSAQPQEAGQWEDNGFFKN